jgi:hypothetical protein
VITLLCSVHQERLEKVSQIEAGIAEARQQISAVSKRLEGGAVQQQAIQQSFTRVELEFDAEFNEMKLLLLHEQKQLSEQELQLLREKLVLLEQVQEFEVQIWELQQDSKARK